MILCRVNLKEENLKELCLDGKIILKCILRKMWGYRVNSTGSLYDPLAGSYKHVNVPLGSMFPQLLCEYHIMIAICWLTNCKMKTWTLCGHLIGREFITSEVSAHGYEYVKTLVLFNMKRNQNKWIKSKLS